MNYKIYPILVKTHRTTVILEAPAGKTVAQLKSDALSAFTSRVVDPDDLPQVNSEDEFELCRESKDKTKQPSTVAGRIPYEKLEVDEIVQKVTQPWEILYVRFRDPESNGAYGKFYGLVIALLNYSQGDFCLLKLLFHLLMTKIHRLRRQVVKEKAERNTPAG